MNNLGFAKQLIKGKIAEIVFEQMIRNMGEYTVIPFGYEHTVPTLAQYQHIPIVKSVMENISDAPDFILVSKNHREVYLVEVKYRKVLDPKEIINHAIDMLKRWNPSFLFVATQQGFCCASCNKIVQAEGQIEKMPESWVDQPTQDAYLTLLREFEK